MKMINDFDMKVYKIKLENISLVRALPNSILIYIFRWTSVLIFIVKEYFSVNFSAPTRL